MASDAMESALASSKWTEVDTGVDHQQIVEARRYLDEGVRAYTGHDLDAAKNAFTMALCLLPPQTEELQELREAVTACRDPCDHDLNVWAEAVKEYDHAIASAKEGHYSYHYFYLRSIAKVELGKCQEALRDADAVINKKPFLSLGYTQKSLVLDKLKQRPDPAVAGAQNLLTIGSLPAEIWEDIFSLCSISESRTIALTCHHWYDNVCHLRFRKASFCPSLHGMMSGDERIGWMLARPRVLRAVRRIDLHCTKAWKASEKVVELWRALINVEYVVMGCDGDASILADPTFQQDLLSLPFRVWTRLRYARVDNLYPCGSCDDIHPSSTLLWAHGRLPLGMHAGIEVDTRYISTRDMPALASCASYLARAAEQSGVTSLKPVFLLKGEQLTCQLAKFALQFGKAGLPVSLSASVRVCCIEALELRAEIAGLGIVQLTGDLASRPRQDLKQIARWFGDIETANMGDFWAFMTTVLTQGHGNFIPDVTIGVEPVDVDSDWSTEDGTIDSTES